MDDYIKNGNWCVGGLSGVALPPVATEVEYRGHTLILIPPRTIDHAPPIVTYPSVALDMPPGMAFEDGQRLISAFASSLAWVKDQPVVVEEFGGGNLPRPNGGYRGSMRADERFELSYLPEPTTDEGRMALAFYREGISLNHVAYQCLSLFKILNMFFGGYRNQIPWMDANLADAKARGFGLQNWEAEVGIPAGQTSGEYLYGSNRCAVAHAGGQPVIDPDDPVDRRRLHQDYPMVKALAIHAIETHLGIKTSMTVYREHLYELAGFGKLLGEALVARVIGEPEVETGAFPAFPPLSIRLRFKETYPAMENLAVEVVDCAAGVVALHLQSADEMVSALIGLNFAEQRIDFTFAAGLISDDDLSLTAARARVQILRFKIAYIQNGVLELWGGGKRLGFKDAYLPENIDMNGTDQLYNDWIAEAEAEVAKRGA